MPGSNEHSRGPEDAKTKSTLVTKPAAKTFPLYQERDFRQTKLQEMYGDKPTNSQLNQFNSYLKSEKGMQDQNAFRATERKKYLDSYGNFADKSIEASRARMKALSDSFYQASAAFDKDLEEKKEDGEKQDNPIQPVEPVPTPPTPPTAPVTPVTPVVEEPKVTPFDLKAFAFDNKLSTRVIDGKTYARYDPTGTGDFWIGEDGTVYKAGMFGVLGSPVEKWLENIKGRNVRYGASVERDTKLYNPLKEKIANYTPSQAYTNKVARDNEYTTWYNNYIKTNPMPSVGDRANYIPWLQQFQASKTEAGFKKQGGSMNRINYFQQGGAAPQQDMQQQIIALVQAAMQGDQKATQTVNKIMEAAKAGDQQAVQLAQMIQQVAQQMQGQAAAAKYGAKLNYIRSLKYAKGGKTCPDCAPNKVEIKKCGGKKAKKHQEGGMAELLPGVGTYYSGKRFFNNPSWKGAGEFGLNLAGDLLLISGLGAGAGAAVKAANYANKASKLVKGASQADKLVDGVRAAGNMAKMQPARGYASVASKAVKANPAAMTGAAGYMDRAADAYRTASRAPMNGIAGFGGTRALNGLINE